MFWQTFWLTNLHFAGELFVTVTSALVVYVLFGVWKGKREKDRPPCFGILSFCSFLSDARYRWRGVCGTVAAFRKIFGASVYWDKLLY